MRRIAMAAVVGLIAVSLARADLRPPGTKNIPVENRIEVDKDYPEWEFFTVRGNGEVKAVKLDLKTPVVIPGSGALGNGPIPKKGEVPVRPYRTTSLVAVPKEAVKQYPTEKELFAAVAAQKVPGAVESKALWDHESVKDTDSRKSVVNRYKLDKIDPKDGVVLQPIKDEPKKPQEEEEAAAPAQSASRFLAVGLAMSGVFAFAGLWLVRRRASRA
jgi:hypothetical protein